MWRFVPIIFRGRLPTILGGLALLSPVFHGILDVLGWAGDVDLIISKYEDPGWVGKVMAFLVNPPGWFILLSIVVGLGLLRWDAVRHRRNSDSSAVGDALPEASKPIVGPPSQASEPSNVPAAVPPAYDPPPSSSAPMSDAARLDAALYAMFEVLTDAAAKGYEIARHVPGEVQNVAFHPSAQHGVSAGIQRLTEADQALVIAIQRLLDIQNRQYFYYRDKLQAVFDNGPLSVARQAIFKLHMVLKELPERPTAGLMNAIQPSFDEFDAAMSEFGRWIFEGMRFIQERRAASSA